MEKLSRNFCLGENSCNNSKSIEKYLQNWKLSPSSASDIYKRNGIFNYSCYFKVQTVKEEIPLSDGYASFNLFSDDLKMAYPKFEYLHLGRVQVALKPTKLDLNKSATICLRNKISILSMVETRLSDGPIYFSHFSTSSGYGFSLSDPDLATSLTLDVKIDGSSEMHGEEKIVLMFRFHYNVMKNFQFVRRRSHFVDERGKTTLYITKVAQGNRVVSRKIFWDRVSVPERWLVENNAAFCDERRRGDARVDWKEAAEAHVLMIDVPGFSEEEVKVEAEVGGGILQISGERREERGEEEGDKWHCAERSSSGKFLRRLKLPENAKLDESTLNLEKGVLTVTVPKVN
ncbi:hypothetical protein AAHA92_26265 [Salvia divinorum]|uniref:SHSP domain-containing protein n=1 Tax=Salvia divinorum TaxID=28513 RepID=A0ABD1GDC5_SALDI